MADESSSDFLREIRLFRGLSPRTLAFVRQHLRTRSFHRGKTLVREGDQAESLYVITEGTVKVSRLTEDGDEAVLRLIGPGDCIGEVTVLAGEPRSATVTAQEAVRALVLPRDVLLAAVRADSGFALALIATLASRLRAADIRLEDAYFSDLGTRLARLLLLFADELGRETDSGIEAPLPLTGNEIASMLGAGRSRTNTAVNDLVDDHVIRRGGRYRFVVLDVDALRRRAGR